MANKPKKLKPVYKDPITELAWQLIDKDNGYGLPNAIIRNNRRYAILTTNNSIRDYVLLYKKGDTIRLDYNIVKSCLASGIFKPAKLTEVDGRLKWS